MAQAPIRVGLVGAGFAATAHLRAYAHCARPPVEVVAIASRSRPRAQALAAEFGVGAVVDGVDALLARRDLDAIDVCTPNASHATLALAALAAGKHVFVEKPLTGYFGPSDAPVAARVGDTSRESMLKESLASADAILDAAKRARRQVAYGENLVYSPVVRRIEDLLVAGGGPILEIRAAECHSGSHSPYARRWRDAGGGALLRLGSHPIGLTLHLKRAEGRRAGGAPIEVAAVSAEGATLQGEGISGYLATGWEDVENWSATTLTFTDGSRAICLASDLALGGVEDGLQVLTGRTRVNANFSHSSLLQAYAPAPEVYPGEPLQEKSHTNAGWSFPPIDAEWVYGFQGELQDFAAAVRDDRPPVSDGLLGRAVVEAIYAAYLSAAEGRRVTLRPID